MFQNRITGPRPVCLIFIEDFWPKFHWFWNSGSGGDFYFKLCRTFCSVKGNSLWNLETIFSPPVLFLRTVPKQYFFVDLGLSLTYCRACVLQFCGHLMGKGWSLAFPMCDVFLFFITFPFGVLVQVWYLIVSIPDLCILPLFGRGHY